MFNIKHINDILNVLNSNSRLFAGNTCLNINAVNPSFLSKKINQELTIAHKLKTVNKIAVHPENLKAWIPPKTTHFIFRISI